jgi:hypothetical protein
MEHSDHFEKVWEGVPDCPCSGQDAGREKVIEAVMVIGMEIHKALVVKGVCPTMIPRAAVMAATIAIAIQEKISAGGPEVHLLQFPMVEKKLLEGADAAHNLIAAACEVKGTT